MTTGILNDTAKTARFAAINIAVAAAVVVLKYVAYALSGSVALYSDALESIVNVITAVVALLAIKIGAKPADHDHPFGHHKAEFLAAIFVGSMIAVAAVLILVKAYGAVSGGVVIDRPWESMAFNAGAGVINALWASALLARGRSARSAALVADGNHLFADVLTSVGVLLGLALALLTGWHILDPLIAAVVAVHILWIGYRISLQSMSMLLDRAASPEVERSICSVIEANGVGALQAHDIRTRQAGRALFIEFHLVVPGSMTVYQAHEICDRLEDAIERAIEGSEVVIHVEPDYKAKSEASGAVPI